MARPIFGIPILSRKIKIQFIMYPRILAIGPSIAPLYFVSNIAVIHYSSLKSSYLIYHREPDHILPLIKDYICIFSMQPKYLL